MVFLAGPRQVGKTWLSQRVLEHFQCPNLYYNWDTPAVKKKYMDDPTFFEAEAMASPEPAWIVHDEIHKRDRWKDTLKGYYDQYRDRFHFLVTGSARLDLFQKSGDSLLGRYLLFRLLPINLAELNGIKPYIYRTAQSPVENIRNLLEIGPGKFWEERLKFSGFPEPLSKGEETSLNQWNNMYQTLCFREELRDLTHIRSLSKAEDLGILLTSRIGSSLSKSSLARDLDCSFDIIDSYLGALEKIYYFFVVPPYSQKLKNVLKKDKKIYLFNDSLIEEEGARFENVVANHLYRAATTWTDLGHGSFMLYFIRDNNKKECDFLMTRNKKPLFLAEAKMGKPSIEAHIRRFSKELGGIPALVLTNLEGYQEEEEGNFFKVSANRFLAGLA